MLWTFVWTSSFPLLIAPPPVVIRINSSTKHIFLLLPGPEPIFSERVINVWNALSADVIDFAISMGKNLLF